MHGIPTAGCNPFSVFFGWFLVWLFVFGLFVLFWFVLPLRGLLTGLCIGPLPALLRLPTNLTALQANYNSAFLLRLNVCNDLAKAMKALDGKKQRCSCRDSCQQTSEGQELWAAEGKGLHLHRCDHKLLHR